MLLKNFISLHRVVFCAVRTIWRSSIGCAPCQGFSSHRKRHWDEEDDVRNSLVMAFATIVGKIMPDVIVMENVPEFLSQKYWRYFSAAKKSYQQLGYTVKEHIYNAAAFGVPQDRFRTIVIGMKKEFLLPEGYLTPNEYRTVRDAISKLPPVAAGVADPNDPMHKSAAHKQSTIDVIRQVPHDGGSRPEGVGPECLDRVRGFYDVYGRLYWDKPSITITHYARNPASGRYTHPEQDRGLTAREAALLQSFPNGFEFTGKSDDIYRQIGEAVPPLLSSAIAANILIELLSTEPTADELSASPQSIDEPVSSSFSSVIAGIKMKDQAAKATKYTCIDSFCGAGGLGLGLKRAGFNILLSFDIDQICIDTIKANKKYFNHPAEAADIADMLNGELLKKCNLQRGELFLLAGGPPCQGFSVQRRGSDTDERNELVLKYGKLIDELYPMYFVMENVTGIAGKRGKTILQQLIEDVEQIGYKVHVDLLDAQDYGVPQRRKRYIIVGERNDLGEHYGGNVVVIVAVHSCLSGAALGVPHLLQRVNDDQLGGGMLGQEIRDLLLQPAADQPGGHGKIQIVRGAVGEVVEAVFDAALGVLKAQIEHIALQCGQTPNGISLCHLQPQPQHQPAFADLAGTADDIDALRNESVHDEHRLAHRRGQQGLCVHGFQFVVHRILLCRMLKVDFGGGGWKRSPTPALPAKSLGNQGFPDA